jgi:hypothetical protein
MGKSFVDHLKVFIETSRKDGPMAAAKAAVWYFRHKYGLVSVSPFVRRRMQLSQQVDTMFDSTVAYGPFKGLKFPKEYWWGRTDRASMLLGLYEQEILVALSQTPATHRTFIDLGAADGYYSLGALVSGLFDRAYSFEQSERGRGILERNAMLNDVGERIFIYGAADKIFYRTLPKEILSKSVLFVDIEGAEFDILDSTSFEAFKGSIIFIESHDYFYDDGPRKLDNLKSAAAKHFRVTELTTTSRDLSKFPELRSFSDTDRWLICDEGRGQMMTWLRLDPR